MIPKLWYSVIRFLPASFDHWYQVKITSKLSYIWQFVITSTINTRMLQNRDIFNLLIWNIAKVGTVVNVSSLSHFHPLYWHFFSNFQFQNSYFVPVFSDLRAKLVVVADSTRSSLAAACSRPTNEYWTVRIDWKNCVCVVAKRVIFSKKVQI